MALDLARQRWFSPEQIAGHERKAMPPTNVSAVAKSVRTTVQGIVEQLSTTDSSKLRAWADSAGELASLADRCPDAVAEAEALLDIAEEQHLADELRQAVSIKCADFFLACRLIQSRVATLSASDAQYDDRLGDALQLAHLLDNLSLRLLSAVDESDRNQNAA